MTGLLDRAPLFHMFHNICLGSNTRNYGLGFIGFRVFGLYLSGSLYSYCIQTIFLGFPVCGSHVTPLHLTSESFVIEATCSDARKKTPHKFIRTFKILLSRDAPSAIRRLISST